MKRMFALFALLVLVSAGLIATSYAAEPITLKLSTVLPAQAPPVGKSLEPWSKMVEKASEGTLKIDIFPGGVLGNNMSMYFEQMESGVFDIALIYPTYFGNRFPETELFFLPFLADTYMEGSVAAQTLFDKGLFSGFKNYKVLAFVATSPFYIATTFPARKPSDLKGHKFRSGSKIQAELIAQLGMTPIGMPGYEAAEGLARGVIQGSLGDPVNLQSFRMADAARNLIMVPMGNFTLVIAMNKNKYESLPPKAKAAIDKYSGLWLARFWAKTNAAGNERLLESWEKDPTRTIVVPTQKELAQWKAALQPVTDKWVKEKPGREKLFKSFVEEVARLKAAGE
jgi:TRAP-type C4-dicarboxylate transport system substrate-binding protein